MASESFDLKVKVIAWCKITEFEGEAILTHPDPRFVVTLQIQDYVRRTDIERYIKPSADGLLFFAIHSIVKVFRESEIVGKVYEMRVQTEVIDGSRSYSLSAM